LTLKRVLTFAIVVLAQVYETAPQLSGLVLLALASAGRGGMGDMGQRIRDEILAIQHRNGCKVRGCLLQYTENMNDGLSAES
jgi:alpha-glucan,water dikinase